MISAMKYIELYRQSTVDCWLPWIIATWDLCHADGFFSFSYKENTWRAVALLGTIGHYPLFSVAVCTLCCGSTPLAVAVSTWCCCSIHFSWWQVRCFGPCGVAGASLGAILKPYHNIISRCPSYSSS